MDVSCSRNGVSITRKERSEIPPPEVGVFSWYDLFMRDIHQIASRIDEILKNERNESLDTVGCYIVGETIVQDDFEEVQDKYPLLERIAELGADLETLEDSKYSNVVYDDMVRTFNQFKINLPKI